MSNRTRHKPHRERLLALVLCGLLAFNYPLLSLFAVPRLVFGIPLLYIYLFGAWMGFILACALLVAERGAKEGGTVDTAAEAEEDAEEGPAETTEGRGHALR